MAAHSTPLSRIGQERPRDGPDKKAAGAQTETGVSPMAGHGSKFGRKKEAAIAALLSQRNHEEAARAADVSKRTLNRWLKLPEFQSAYLEARRAVMFQANARLQQASSAAVSALLKVMVDPSTPASARVRAADCILARGNLGLENEDLEVRLAALERSAALAKVPGQY
jgi:membrane-bound ClpP family serine protease